MFTKWDLSLDTGREEWGWVSLRKMWSGFEGCGLVQLEGGGGGTQRFCSTGWRETRNQRQEANVCQFLINTLEDDVFGVPLDHITGEAIARGDPRSVKDLLEIFCELTDEFCGRSPLAGKDLPRSSVKGHIEYTSAWSLFHSSDYTQNW